MKIKNKIAIILILAFVGLCIMNCYSFADEGFTGYYKPTVNTDDKGGFLVFSNKIIGVVSVIASAVALITLIIIGIKYVVGSVEEKAQYKETLKPYLIGSVMVFGIFAILGASQSIIDGFLKGII